MADTPPTIERDLYQTPSTFIALALLSLPAEIVSYVLSFLPIPDLLAISRTCHQLRHLALDPLLHRQRLVLASHALSISLPHRPPLSSLRPPVRNIYLTSTLFQARRVGRRLIGIRLSRQLDRRPSVGELVGRGVLPNGCFVLVPTRSIENEKRGHGYDEDGSELARPPSRKEEWVRTTMSPQVMATRQSLERERVKDRLRSFLSGRGKEEMERRVREQRAKEQQDGVRVLVKRFAKREKGDADSAPRWGKDRKSSGKPERPARANVLGMRRFWENIGGAGGGTA